jgi:hypothetical protein
VPGAAPSPDADQREIARLKARVAALEARESPAARPGGDGGSGPGGGGHGDGPGPGGPGPGGGRAARGVRAVCSTVLIVLACLLVPLSALSVWAADEIGSTHRYVATVAPLARDHAVQDAVADKATDAVMRRVDLKALLKQLAPADRKRLSAVLGALSGTLTGAVRSFVHDRTHAVVASAAFASIWEQANRTVHAAAVKALTGQGGGVVKLRGDTVSVDIGPVIDRVKDRLAAQGLSAVGNIPPVHTDFVVLRSDQVRKLRPGFRLLRLAGDWVPVISVLCAAGGVLLARRRRRALVATALGFAFAALVLGLALTVFRGVYLDALPSGVARPAAGAVYDALVAFLRQWVRVVLVLGIVVALGAWLSGPGRRAVLVRGMWRNGLGGARAAAERAGMRTGPVGPWVHHFKRALCWVVVAAGAVAFVVWDRPTPWVVVGLALTVLVGLAVLELLDEHGPPRRGAHGGGRPR